MSLGWVQVDNAFGEHPRFLALDDEMYLACIGLFIVTVAWCDHHRSDGVIPRKALRRICPNGHEKETDELLRVGLFEERGTDIEVHDYLDWQRSAEEIEASSTKARDAARARWGNASSNASSNAKRYAEESRVDESRVDESRVDAFTECASALETAFGTILPATQVIKLQRLCSDYEGKSPSALERIRFGIETAKKEGKPKVAFAIGCAANAGADEMMTTSDPDENWSQYGVPVDNTPAPWEVNP